MKMTWFEWWAEVQRIYEETYPPYKLTKYNKIEWRPYYDDGYTPQQAIDDEATHV